MGLNQPDLARVQIDLAIVRGALREYRMLNEEKNPPDLSALHLQLFFPGDITYDPGSGTVKSRTYPAF